MKVKQQQQAKPEQTVKGSVHESLRGKVSRTWAEHIVWVHKLLKIPTYLFICLSDYHLSIHLCIYSYLVICFLLKTEAFSGPLKLNSNAVINYLGWKTAFMEILET